MVTQKQFDKGMEKFEKIEKRGSLYPRFRNLIDNGFETEAYLMMLSTWNFATFRYVNNTLDINKFERLIHDLNPTFNQFNNQNIKDIELTKFYDKIALIYSRLSEVKEVEYTGASKLMHLAVPEVFVMWDTYIRKAYGFKKTTSLDYFEYLDDMQQKFKDLIPKQDRTLAKAIDEYNYVKYTLPALKEQRKVRQVERQAKKEAKRLEKLAKD